MFTHRVLLNGALCFLVSFVEIVLSVDPALEARLFLDWVVRTVLRGDDPGDWNHRLREDERLEHRPVGRLKTGNALRVRKK